MMNAAAPDLPHAQPAAGKEEKENEAGQEYDELAHGQRVAPSQPVADDAGEAAEDELGSPPPEGEQGNRQGRVGHVQNDDAGHEDPDRVGLPPEGAAEQKAPVAWLGQGRKQAAHTLLCRRQPAAPFAAQIVPCCIMRCTAARWKVSEVWPSVV